VKPAKVFKGPLGWHVQLSGVSTLYWFDSWFEALEWAVRMVEA
jgi:hypothetical protein